MVRMLHHFIKNFLASNCLFLRILVVFIRKNNFFLASLRSASFYVILYFSFFFLFGTYFVTFYPIDEQVVSLNSGQISNKYRITMMDIAREKLNVGVANYINSGPWPSNRFQRHLLNGLKVIIACN